MIRGEAVADWRDVALVEHHGLNFDPSDADLAEPNSGNPPTYATLRTKRFVYVEYVGGETEFRARATDPNELDNTAAALTPAQTTALHDTLAAITSCHTVATCWTAQHMLPGAPRAALLLRLLHAARRRSLAAVPRPRIWRSMIGASPCARTTWMVARKKRAPVSRRRRRN